MWLRTDVGMWWLQVEDCILWLCIVFLTIICSPPPTVLRWSSSPAVSAERQLKWKGFCALIANAYYARGMAWYGLPFF